MAKTAFFITTSILPILTGAVLIFKLEQYNFCPDLRNQIVKFNKDDIKLKIGRNVYSIVGTINMTQAITKPVELHVKVLKCDSPTSCTDFNFIKLPQICAMMKNVSWGDYGIGDFFTPKVRCPAKAGQYTVNVSQSLDKLTSMPIGSNLFKVRLTFYELYSASKKSVAACFEGLIRSMSASSRKN